VGIEVVISSGVSSGLGAGRLKCMVGVGLRCREMNGKQNQVIGTLRVLEV